MTAEDTRTALHAARRRRWTLALALVFMAGLALVLLFLLTLATRNRTFYEQNFSWLVAVNVGVAVLLALSILWLAVRLFMRYRLGLFGSRLLLKLAMIIGLVGVLPGVLIYTVSYQFVARSIESWFDVRVESALAAGLNLGRTTLDTLSADLSGKTRIAADELARMPTSSAVLTMERLRSQLGASDMVLWSGAGQALATAGASRFDFTPNRPPLAMLRTVKVERVVAQIEGLEDGNDVGSPPANVQARIKVLALVSAPGFELDDEPRYLQVVVPLPAALVTDALAVQAANREYQERALGREGLRRMYIGTLTLALFLSVFGAVLLAVVLGNQMVRPLLVLAEGMREVAQGDLSPKTALASRDELASLTRTFASMTQELSDARATVQHSMQQVDAARGNLQTILDNLTAGVAVLDGQCRLRSVNPGAARILGAPLEAYLGQPLSAVPGLESFGQSVRQQFEAFLSDGDGVPPEGGHWEQSFELGEQVTSPQGQGITLIARGALLPNEERLLVFDDVSDMVSAQRARAWADVARRLAHEIKNPLTPIQLSAERLAMKLEGKVQPAEQAVLNKSVKTIVDQVDAMKRLVNEFRDYARLPAAQLAPTDLNALIRDILVLYDHAAVPVQTELADDLPLVMADAQQVRQILHNLVQNAQDAMTGQAQAAVRLRTRRSDGGPWVRLSVIDQGPGFAEHILKRAFEPYVTTKAKGTGLGLAVVRKIMEEHGGRVDISNRIAEGRVTGAQVSLSFAVAN